VSAAASDRSEPSTPNSHATRFVGVDSGTDDASFVAQVCTTDSDARAAGDVGCAVVATGVIPFSACWIRRVCAGLMVSLLPGACGSVGALPLPSGPQMTRRMGKSFAQLLTSSAVLTAVGLAGEGGGRGWTVWTGPVGVRRSGGGGGDEGGGGGAWVCDVAEWWLFSAFMGGGGPPLALGLESLLYGCGESRDGLVGLLDCGKDGKTGDVGSDGAVVVARAPRGFGARTEAESRTVRWWASVARAFRLRKKKYWMMMGARASGDAVTD
jgi:hypothetical protein